MTFTFKRG